MLPLALVASAHGAVRVLEQAVRAAVGAGALGVGARGIDADPGISRVYLVFCRYTRVLPGGCANTVLTAVLTLVLGLPFDCANTDLCAKCWHDL